MTELTNPRVIWLKGALFLLGGSIAAALLLLEELTLRRAFLLGISIWCFCRAYYFAFYVVERYVDSSYRFAGLLAFARYALLQSRRFTSSRASVSRKDS